MESDPQTQKTNQPPNEEEEEEPLSTTIIKQEQIHDEEEEEEDDEFEDDDEEEEDLNSISPSTSSDDPNKFSSNLPPPPPPVILTPTPITAAPPPPPTQTPPPPSTDAKKKPPPPSDDSRKLFQRLWTDEDEIGLLQGFLDFTNQRGALKSSYHQDTGPFYDQIKTCLQLDFNKSQLVEKLRRLKKKYRNAVARLNSGKDLFFKTPHDQATYEISRKIWGNENNNHHNHSIGGLDDAAGVEDDESNRYPSAAANLNNNNEFNNSNNNDASGDKKVPGTPQRRPLKRKAEDDLSSNPPSSIQTVIEDTVRSCLSPLFKELLHSTTSNVNGSLNLGGGTGGLLGGVGLNPLSFNFGATTNSMMNFSGVGGEVIDDKWRKQQILELEVYSKRIELVQEQIKSALEDLRSKGT